MSFRKWQLISFVLFYVVYGALHGWRLPAIDLGFLFFWAANCVIWYFPVAIVVGIFEQPQPIDKYIEMERRLRDAA